MLQLYHNDMSSCSQKVRFALEEKGLPWGGGQELDLRAGDQLRPAFLKINPKGLVPALVHDGTVILESNVILEYLEDAFPETPLMPADPVGRAKVRLWMRRLDERIHLDTVAVSFGIAFRHQLLKVCTTPEALERHLSAISDPDIRQIQRDVLHAGADAPRFHDAVRSFDRLLADLDAALAASPWLAGERLSLADIAYAPYATRLEHLALEGLWAKRPHFAAWYARLKDTHGYRKGIADWFNRKYLPLMHEAGRAVRAKVENALSV